jgi:hypothetical protein
MRHTRAPWKAVKLSKSIVIRSDSPSYQRDYVAEIHWSGGEAPDGRVKDALLICAAPEMLAYLTELRASYTSLPLDVDMQKLDRLLKQFA